MTSLASATAQTHSDQKVANMLKAIGHPVRLGLVRKLLECHACCCGEMCDCFTLSQSTVSQHLSVLKDAGIVSVTRKGTKSSFSIEADSLQFLRSEIDKLIGSAWYNKCD